MGANCSAPNKSSGNSAVKTQVNNLNTTAEEQNSTYNKAAKLLSVESTYQLDQEAQTKTEGSSSLKENTVAESSSSKKMNNEKSTVNATKPPHPPSEAQSTTTTNNDDHFSLTIDVPPPVVVKTKSHDSRRETGGMAPLTKGYSLKSPRFPGDSETRKLAAVNILQRQARRIKAMKAAQAEQQWKLFADLDTQDEAEMLHIAVFMQTLIDTVPTTNTNRKPANLMSEEQEGSLSPQLVLSPLQSTDEEPEGGYVINIGGISLNETKLTLDNYEIHGHEITPQIASEIMEVYRKGGKLSRQAVVKILRRTYRTLLKLPNITHMTVEAQTKLTVVGDLHGQIQDLLYIIDTAGLPSHDNKFIFNGDFVDRGTSGLEIMCVLFAFFVAFGPETVCLNRGNHEDLAVCRVYGFEGEVKTKYDDLLFEMFAEVFHHLPLFAIINENEAFVVHGGLFHNPEVSIADLMEITRSDYFVKPPVPYPQNIQGLGPAEARLEYLKQLQRDALWSDPTEEQGCYLNPRGAGISFGPNYANAFMKKHGFKMIIRSHECVKRGFDLPFSGGYDIDDLDPSDQDDNWPLVCTLFSASNYIGGDNEGAVVTFMSHPFSDSKIAGKYSSLHFIVNRYKTSQASTALLDTNYTSLFELLMKKKSPLSLAFEAIDTENRGLVSRLEWSEVMLKVTSIKIRWLSIISTIVPADALSPNAMIDYRKFLSSLTLGNKIAGKGGDSGAAAIMDDMYGQRKRLEQVFFFFDTNGDGVISLEEFRNGCEILNQSLPPEMQLTNVDRALEVMDFDGSGTIDINEFFETFRILDAKDGKVDGVISLAKRD